MATKLLYNPAVEAPPAYDQDLAAWAHHQAMLLRAGQVQSVDRAHIAEEMDDVGSEQYDRLESALRLVLIHMLKWDHQPARQSRSWTLTIREQRIRISRQLRRNPSLAARREEVLSDAYGDARYGAGIETDLPLKNFPETCPYSWQDIMTRPFNWPGDDD